MINSSRISGALLLVCLIALSTSPASAAKDRFYRTKPHVNVSTAATLTGDGTPARVDPSDPSKKRPR